MKRQGPPEDDGILRPRMGRRRPPDRERAPSFHLRMARAAQKHAGGGGRGRRARNQPGRVAVREPHALSRRCIIKARYVPMTATGRKLAKLHLAYLERDGVERDGSPGRLYGADQKFSADEFHEALVNEQRQFRFIVSPEDGGHLDLTEFARQFMRQVEKDTGRGLIWAAVNHHDTDNPHVHILVRGVDREGDDLRIDGRYISREMRWRAQELLTRELGRRSEMDLSMDWAADVGRGAFTEIDRALADHSSPDGAVTLAKLLAAPGGEGRACLARLQVLEEMQLATKESAGTWRLAKGWKPYLGQLGEDHEAHRRLRALVGDEAHRYQVLRRENPIPVADGVVVGKGLHDELTGEMFAAIKTADGRALYLRLPPALAEGLQERDVVRVGFEGEPWLKPADRIVARFAQENGGVYDPVRHQRALEALHRPAAGGDQPTWAERVTANVRRLERLARYRLVARLPDGRWQVPADLVAQLEARERTHPQHRLRLEKAVSPAREPVRQPAHAVDAERDALARALAKDLGLRYVSEPPAFKGRVAACTPTASGREYLRIVDYRTGQFTLIQKSPGAERLLGRTVHLTRDRDRGISLQVDRGISR
jgi:type IV secretory pathway VirD2 relaxase